MRSFVGRVTELSRLSGLMQSAETGPGGVILIAGPAGIGKSALVSEAVNRFAGGPWRVSRGFCADDAGAPPLWPWRRSLRLAGVPAQENAPAPTDPAALAAARFQQLTRAADGLAEAALSQPLLIVLEDLHWADTATLDLLRQVAQQADRGLVVLGTFREPVPALAALSRYGVEILKLSPFTTAEIGQLLGDGVDAAAVAERTGGLPLLVAAASGEVNSVVDGLLAAVPEQLQPILVTAALLSGEPDLGLLTQISGHRAGEALAAGLNAGLLTTGQRFSHALIQEALAAKADPDHAASVHRQAAQALAGSASAARVGAHWRRAGRDPHALRQTAFWYQAAARQAQQLYAIDDAISLLEIAYEALSQVDDSPELLLELAAAQHLAGRYADSLRHCSQTAELGRRLGRPELIAQAALVLRNVSYLEAGRIVVNLCELALSYPGLEPALRARVLAQAAAIWSDAGAVQQAGEAAQQALELAADPLAELDAIRAREMTLYHPSDTPERLRLAERAISLAQTLGDPVSAIVAHSWRIRGGYQVSRLDITDTSLSAMAAITETHALPLTRWHYLRAVAARAALEGDFATARGANIEAAELAKRTGDSTALGMSFIFGLQLAEVRGDPGELLPSMLESLAGAPRIPLITCAFACVNVLLGRMGEARRYYEELAGHLREPVVDFRWGGVIVQAARLAEVFTDAATGSLVAQHLQPWAPYPGAVGTTTSYFIGSVSQILGRLALLAGNAGEAVTLQRAAIQHNIALRARPYVVLSKMDLAKALIASGQRDQAAPLLADAVAEARRLDMPGCLAEAAQLAETDDPLSPREREVATLVLQAKTNRQIADQLVLSERTVESHVRSILLKLGCANRAELIARHKISS